VSELFNLRRLAEDLMVFTTEEFCVVELADGHARASKIMPQKKNPFSLAYVRSAANQAIGAQAALAASGRTPSGQMDSRMLCYGELPRLLKLATGATEVMHAVLGGLSVSEDNAARTLRSFVAATDLAETLVLETGMDYRAAHRLVGHIARTLRVDHRAADSLMPEDVASAGLAALGMTVTISSDVLDRALDPRAAVASRTSAGGAAAAPMAEMIAECRRMLDQGIAWQASMVEHTERVRVELLAAARQSIGEA
jgi:argininosuccinate lyase